jgi:hypothetical protein
MWRDDRQVGKGPFAFLHFELFRDRDLEQMTDGGRKHVSIAFVIIVHFLEAPQGLGNIGRHGRLLRDDQCLAHVFLVTALFNRD